ncbi:curli assembly protein CsgF [Moheibacter lacus]|uniref:Curli production assembly/transport component CsgF n=1 Tax=Moheibacter lacus TaxID=2745851 RepID=A0A838ZS63_9FLAO|nr:curli assembly protein CsgF [Moheibacter lacus]MBA5629743.1 curli assembly protein CsgF [Moheibacter lacus]
MKTLSFLILFTLFSIGNQLYGQQLNYEPVNPNFGGSYLNYSWLLSSANAQNPFDDQDMSSGLDNSPLSNFEDSIKRQILNQLTRGMFGNGTGEGGIGTEPGTYEIGGLVITIDETRTGSILTIIDSQTGEYTEIIL